MSSTPATHARPRAAAGAPPPRRWRAVVVDRSVRAAARHAAGLITDRRLSVALATVAEAPAALTAAPADLVFLNGDLPELDARLVALLRSALPALELVVLTAAPQTERLRAALHAGAVDIVLLPAAPQRLRAAVDAFEARARALALPERRQADIDAARRGAPADALEPGLDAGRMAAAVRALAAAADGLDAEGLAARVGTTRVTARRYLAALDRRGQVDVESRPGGRGRPRDVYRLRAKTR